MSGVSEPRSLADDLRQRDDEALTRLLRLRPDLLHPVPPDFTALTTRATSGPAVARCLDGLDALHLHVLRAAAEASAERSVADAVIIKAASAALPDDARAACKQALGDLVDLALVWGPPRARRTVTVVRDLVASAQPPRWPAPDPSTGDRVDLTQADAQAALHARESLALVRDLLDDWAVHPPGVLRSGGLGLRDFAAVRSRLHTDWARASLTIETAHGARLFADDEEEPAHWVPTEHYDAWVGQEPAEQWLALIDAWLTLPRLPALADERTRVLTSDRDRRAIPVLRRDVLALLAGAEPGTVLPEADILAVLDDRAPRRSGELRQLTVAATLREAADLGLLGFGALSTPGRLIVAAHDAASPAERRRRLQEVARTITAALPVDVDHVVIQGDLTVTAPGPLAASASRSLRLLADVESRGHATVYRVSETSLRRALDAGWDAEAIRGLLTQLSRTPIPQALDYLIDDVARRHGAVRVGSALAYVRSDNTEVLAALVTDRRLRPLGLHRLADTVVIASSPTSEVISALRSAGYAPAAESPDGAIVVRRPEERRVRTPRPPSSVGRLAPEPALVTAAVRALRAGDQASAPRSGAAVAGPAGAPVPLSASAVATALRTAIADTRSVWIGYAGTDGTVTQSIVDPIRLQAGVLTAFDHRTDSVRQYSVTRVTGVADAPGG